MSFKQSRTDQLPVGRTTSLALRAECHMIGVHPDGRGINHFNLGFVAWRNRHGEKGRSQEARYSSTYVCLSTKRYGTTRVLQTQMVEDSRGRCSRTLAIPTRTTNGIANAAPIGLRFARLAVLAVAVVAVFNTGCSDKTNFYEMIRQLTTTTTTTTTTP